MNARAASIASALIAMRRLGVDAVIDFSIKCRLPDFLLEHTMQASLLMGQDRFVLRLPIVQAKEGSPIIMDHMTVIRTDPMPVVGPDELGDDIPEALSNECETGEFEPEVDLVLAEQVARQAFIEDYGIEIEGFGI